MGAAASAVDLAAEYAKPLDGSDVATPRGQSALAEVKRLRGLMAEAKAKGNTLKNASGLDYRNYLPSYVKPAPEVTEVKAKLVQNSFEALASGQLPNFIAQKEGGQDNPVLWFGGTFYDRLFEVAPQVKPMFTSPREVQAGKLAGILGAAVKILTDPDTLAPILRELAKSHIARGVVTAQYAIVGEVLLWTLEQSCGDMWNPELADAWLEVYSLMMHVMIPEAMAGDPAPAQKEGGAEAAAGGAEAPAGGAEAAAAGA